MRICFSIPLDWNLSKNKKYIDIRLRKGNKKIINPNFLKIQESIFYKILEQKPIFKKEKLKVDILVMRNTLRGDIHNLIEGINDAIKLYTKRFSLDDNLFTGTYDYICQKNICDNKIIITISQ